MLKKLLILIAVVIPFASCTTADEGLDGNVYEKGTPTIETAAAGNQRVQITWKPNDTVVEGSYIYWNGGADSEFVYFSAGTQEVTTIITMEAGDYTFYVQNVLEDESLSTASASTKVSVYDSSYAANYSLCPILGIFFDDEFGGMITWDDADDCVGNMVYYEDYDGNAIQKYCPIEEGTSYLEGAALNTKFTYVSYYVPVEGGIDNLATDPSDGTDVLETGDGVIIVKSLDAFMPYLRRDNVNVQLVEGTYPLGPDDVRAQPDLYGELVQTRTTVITHVALYITGSNSTYDFGNSVIEFDNSIMNTMGYEFFNMHIVGNNNTIKNVTLEDVGDLETYPLNDATVVVIDGIENYLENVIAMPKGSYPYGYGELFGKGGGPVIAHYKNGGILVRGEDTHIYRCQVIHQALCHAIFIQGAWEPIIDECYVQGVMIVTDEVLDDTRSQYDEGSNGRPRAYDVDYRTDFWDATVCPYSGYSDCDTYCGVGNDHNYTVPAGFTISLIEDGIRTYNNSHTIINGVYYPDSHDTQNTTIKGCVVKHARGGITTPLQSGWTYVDDCTTIGNDRGIAIGNNGADHALTCYSDFKYGTAFNIDYNAAKTQNVSITLIDANLPERINGYKAQNNVGYVKTSDGGYVWPSQSVQESWSTVNSLATGISYADCTNYQPEGTEGMIRQIAFIQGTSHTIKFYADTYGTGPSTAADPMGVLSGTTYSAFDDDYYAKHCEYIIKVGGDEEIMDALFKDDNYSATSVTLYNYTKFRVVLDKDSTKCTVYSVGPVENYGSSNTVNYIAMP
ncbi:MAG: DUF4998 domain-containing protein [Rikenellaceae bacterium]